MVKKCLNKEFASDIFDDYFEMIDHSMNIRNNKHCVGLPPVKLQVARRGFYFTGGTLYNSLPVEIRKIDSVNIFKKKVSEFFQVFSLLFALFSHKFHWFYILNFLLVPFAGSNSCFNRSHFSGPSCHSGFYFFILDSFILFLPF